MKLFLLQVGRVRPPDQVEETILPVPAYLIETDTGEHILIDTGLNRRLIGAHHQPHHPHLLNEEEDLLTLLARLNLTAQDIRLVICSHFDPDHAGNLALFQQAEIVVQRRLYAAAIKGEVPRFERTRDQWDAPGLRFLLVDGDTTLVPGVRLLESEGHTPGHQSVLVSLPRTGPVLLAIDAIPLQAQRDPATRAIEPFDLNELQVRASTSKLRAIEQHEGVAFTVYGHDPHQWQTLKHFPDFYA
jgi:N-acyl homoserine lactone hydrolase